MKHLEDYYNTSYPHLSRVIINQFPRITVSLTPIICDIDMVWSLVQNANQCQYRHLVVHRNVLGKRKLTET